MAYEHRSSDSARWPTLYRRTRRHGRARSWTGRRTRSRCSHRAGPRSRWPAAAPCASPNRSAATEPRRSGVPLWVATMTSRDVAVGVAVSRRHVTTAITSTAAAASDSRGHASGAHAPGPPDLVQPRRARDLARPVVVVAGRRPPGTGQLQQSFDGVSAIGHGSTPESVAKPSRNASRARVSSDSTALVVVSRRSAISRIERPWRYFHSRTSP